MASAFVRRLRPTKMERPSVFSTSMGTPEDFRNDDFRRLLVNAIFWTARRDPEKMKK